MAERTNTQPSAIGNQVVGKVAIIYGTVKAISPGGVVRTLTVNSPIFTYDRIVTDSNGSVSIMLDGPSITQVDIGRMMDVMIDEDVFAGVTPETVTDATADVNQTQQALLAGNLNIELEPTAEGGEAAGAGGGHPIVSFDVDGTEVTPGSGADTEGISSETTDNFGTILDNDQGVLFANVDSEDGIGTYPKIVRTGSTGPDNLEGGSEDDILLGDGGDDTLSGLGGEDILSGGLGEDNLDGGEGNDILVGGPGDDIMTGGLGADRFKVGLGDDRITDYSKSEGDVVDINDLFEESAGDSVDISRNADGTTRLSVFGSDGAEKGSVSFDNISFDTVTSNDELNSLLGMIDLDIDPENPTS